MLILYEDSLYLSTFSMEANFKDCLPCYNKLSGNNSASFVFCLILSPLLRIIIQAKNLDH